MGCCDSIPSPEESLHFKSIFMRWRAGLKWKILFETTVDVWNFVFLWMKTNPKLFKYFQERELWWNISFLIRKVNFWINFSCHWKQSKNLPWTLEISHCKCCQNQYFSLRHPRFDTAPCFDQKQTSFQTCWLVPVRNKLGRKVGKGTGTLILAVWLSYSSC